MKEITVFAILSIFILFFTGCPNTGVKGHQVFTKGSNLQIETISQIMSNLDYDNNFDFNINSHEMHLTYDINDSSLEELTNDSKVITQYISKKGVACGGSNAYIPAIVRLCSQGIPKKPDTINSTYYQALAINQNLTPKYAQEASTIRVAVIIRSKKLKTHNLLDEYNLSKGDICIYPLTNLDCDTLNKGDWVTIPKKELDKTLLIYEDEKQ